MNGKAIIDELREYITELEKEHKYEIEIMKRKLKIIEKYINKEPENETEYKELFSLLCYKNIAYCCGIEKDCYWRDIVLFIIGISKENYKNWKEEVGKNFIKAIMQHS